jgi:hypothetical protein
MNRKIITIAVALGLGVTTNAFAANGSIAAAWVKDAYNANKRIELQKANRAACEAGKPTLGDVCKPDIKAKKVTNT